MKARLKYLTIDEYVKIVGKKPQIEDVPLNDVIKVIKKALRDEKFKDFLFNMLKQAFDGYLTFI